MKKVYQKPLMAVELFALTQSIASCDVKIGSTDSGCIINDPHSSNEMKDLAYAGMFYDGCDQTPAGMDTEDGICVHTNVNQAFNS